MQTNVFSKYIKQNVNLQGDPNNGTKFMAP